MDGVGAVVQQQQQQQHGGGLWWMEYEIPAEQPVMRHCAIDENQQKAIDPEGPSFEMKPDEAAI
ncbi:hypothetical protein M419DRAFT_8495 [Trichoderma reesei RUT C-30]|uniref:Uncharacterized protein n=1 Tax=Hypocrea jecorina (strain ATCC 56765 / BCRC 32924 / NRRL 11460 / Rut C-30) TaxID=1344414 RepID=A0A024S9W3_HYPJR|nr:hypothetical protein M419DRAFT_8495 [Trichoderma reesei RUT C-30]